MLTQLQRLPEAIASCDRAIELAPDYADAHVNRGVALAYLKQWQRAVASYDHAIELRPDHVRAHVNRAIALLSAGNFADGWAAFEWRLKEYDESWGAYSQPIWRGTESLAGKSILLYGEPGLGDTIQFCRYARLAADLGAHVILHVQRPLERLLSSLGTDVQVVTQGAHVPNADYCCPLMSLPLAFKTTLSSIPARIPYLHGDADKVLFWRAKLGERRKHRVGLVWSGGFRFDACWRWLSDRVDSPWYPSVKLYRQESPGDWAGVVEQVRRDLAQDLIASRR